MTGRRSCRRSIRADLDGAVARKPAARRVVDSGMRDGFRTGTYNSRAVHWVDPTGKPERELAEQFRRKAEEVENAGFQRFAVTLRGLAEGYNREAERIIGDHKDRDDDYYKCLVRCVEWPFSQDSNVRFGLKGVRCHLRKLTLQSMSANGNTHPAGFGQEEPVGYVLEKVRFSAVNRHAAAQEQGHSAP
jgi:hypothetical protein